MSLENHFFYLTSVTPTGESLARMRAIMSLMAAIDQKCDGSYEILYALLTNVEVPDMAWYAWPQARSIASLSEKLKIPSILVVR